MGKGKKDKKDKKHKSGKGAADASIALKIPKSLRKAGDIAKDLAKEPVVSEIVAAALLSAAAALREKPAVKKAAGATGEAAADAAVGAGEQASKVGDALRTLALDLARRTLDNWDRPGGKAGKARGRESEPAAGEA